MKFNVRAHNNIVMAKQDLLQKCREIKGGKANYLDRTEVLLWCVGKSEVFFASYPVQL